MDSGDGGTESWPGRWDGRTDPDDDDDGGHGTDGGHETGGDDGHDRTLNWTDDADDGENGTADDGSGGRGPLARVRWVMRTDEEWVAFVREVVSSLAIVAAIGLLLFALSGVWPPMVAIESSSMAPNLQTGDLVFIMEEHRFAGAAAINGTGVVTYQTGAATGYKQFNLYGEVIVYHPNGNEQQTPIIHRARFWVTEGENWYDEANQSFLGDADNCEELANCPAPHAGFITKGDNNGVYDQVDTGLGPISSPVKSDWVVGTAEFRIPWLGRIRLFFGRVSASVLDASMTIGTAGEPVAGAFADSRALRAAG